MVIKLLLSIIAISGICLSMYGIYQLFTQIIESCVFIFLSKEEIRKGKLQIPQPDIEKWAYFITGGLALIILALIYK